MKTKLEGTQEWLKPTYNAFEKQKVKMEKNLKIKKKWKDKKDLRESDKYWKEVKT